MNSSIIVKGRTAVITGAAKVLVPQPQDVYLKPV